MRIMSACDGEGLVDVSPEAPTGDCPHCKGRRTEPDSVREVGEAIAQLKADAQALADMRTLDAWKAASPERSIVLDGDGHFWCRLGDWPRPGIRDMRGFDAPTPEAARAKAAAWVREQKP